MASYSIRIEMTNMVNTLLRQEEEMMQIGSNEKKSKLDPDTLPPSLCTSYQRANVNTHRARVTHVNDYKDRKQLQISDVVLKSRTQKQEPLQKDQIVRMQIQEKPFTGSDLGQVTGIPGHGNSYQIAPLDSSQEKLRNRHSLEPKEPNSDGPPGTPEHNASTQTHSIDRGEAPAKNSKIVASPGSEQGITANGQPSSNWDSCELGKCGFNTHPGKEE